MYIACRLVDGLYWGYNYHYGNVNDFKNFAHDLHYHIGGTDAEYLVDNMKDKMNHVSNFYFEYKTNVKRLEVILLGDKTWKLHYKEFGDILSFDPTLKTNMQCYLIELFSTLFTYFS